MIKRPKCWPEGMGNYPADYVTFPNVGTAMVVFFGCQVALGLVFVCPMAAIFVASILGYEHPAMVVAMLAAWTFGGATAVLATALAPIKALAVGQDHLLGFHVRRFWLYRPADLKRISFTPLEGEDLADGRLAESKVQVSLEFVRWRRERLVLDTWCADGLARWANAHGLAVGNAEAVGVLPEARFSEGPA